MFCHAAPPPQPVPPAPPGAKTGRAALPPPGTQPPPRTTGRGPPADAPGPYPACRSFFAFRSDPFRPPHRRAGRGEHCRWRRQRRRRAGRGEHCRWRRQRRRRAGRGGPCFARIAWAPARGRGRAYRGGAARAPDCAREAKGAPLPPAPSGPFSRHRNPKRPPDNRLLPPHLRGGGVDFKSFQELIHNFPNKL